jgi:hypothetical protein
MESGYLTVEKHPEHEGIIRIGAYRDAPHPPDAAAGGHTCYVAEYTDLDAALMHAHEKLRRALVDINHHLYRTNCAEAIAAVKSSSLTHREVWIDPDLDKDVRAKIEQRTKTFRLHRQRVNRIAAIIGGIAIGLLLLSGLLSMFAR